MYIAVIILLVVILFVTVPTTAAVVARNRPRALPPGPAAAELESAVAREQRRADMAEAELKVVRRRLTELESQLHGEEPAAPPG